MKFKKKTLWISAGIIGIAIMLLILNSMNKPTYPVIDSPRPILGNPNASVKIVEFSDLQCPACKFAANFPQRLISDFGENISVEFKHFPLTTIHGYAYKAAEAAECANDQGKFWEFIDISYKNQPDLSVRDLKGYAKTIGLNTTSFNACLDSDAKSITVDNHIREGYSLDIPGTPTFFVNGKILTTIKYEDIEAEVISQLNQK